MSRAHSPQELADQFARSSQLVNEELDLSSRERALLNVILRWSLKRGREWATFSGFEHLGGLAAMDRTHASTCVSKLQREGLLHCTRRRGEVRCRWLPAGALVPPAPKSDPLALQALAREADQLNALPEGFDPDGQRLMELPTVEETVDNDLARESRERARAGARGAAELPGQLDREKRTDSVRKGETYRFGTDEKRTDSVRSQTRAAARAGHVHVPTSFPKSMNHDHGHARGLAEGESALRALSSEELEARLDEECRYMLASFEALPGIDVASYHRTWLLRLNDGWRGVALRALAECLSMRVAGRAPRTGWGEAANYFFKLWKPQPAAKALAAREP